MSNQLHNLLQNAELWPLSLSVVGPVLGALALSTFLFSTSRKSLPNEPPMVPYSIPWLGHSLSLLWDSKRFLAEANAKYGEMYTIIYFGRKFVIIGGKSAVTEMFKADNDYISFQAAANEIVPAENLFKLSYSHRDLPDLKENFVAPVLRDRLRSHQLGVFQSQIIEATNDAIDKEIGPNGATWNDPMAQMQHFVSRISCLCFAGEEIGRDEALITTMAEITNKLIVAGIVATNLPTWLGNPIIKRLFSLRSALDVIFDRAKPMLDRRLLRKQQEPDWEPPQDMLQWMQDTPRKNGDDRETSNTAFFLSLLGLASIHTTSMNSLFAFHDLAVRPDVVATLREDIAKATAEAGGVLTPEVTDKVSRLDSLVRETLRLNGDLLGMRHLAVDDYAFKNGMVVKKNTLLMVSVDSLHRNPDIQPAGKNDNLDEFDAFRFTDLPSKKSHNVSPSFVPFGEGPHTCPGRFFAVQEIKFLIASILMRYNIKTTSKERVPNKYMFGMATFPPNSPITFEPIETKKC